MTAEVVEDETTQNAVTAGDPEAVADHSAVGLNLDQRHSCKTRLGRAVDGQRIGDDW